jgi:hypothetical protein
VDQKRDLVELKDTMRAISSDARGWLKVWARAVWAPGAFEPTEAALHEDGQIGALRRRLGKPRVG